jgi:hypothetical protein
LKVRTKKKKYLANPKEKDTWQSFEGKEPQNRKEYLRNPKAKDTGRSQNEKDRKKRKSCLLLTPP